MNTTFSSSAINTREKAQELRKLFPILQREVNGKPLVYLDNAASSQKPRVVIDAISEYYTKQNSNVHRGVHTLSQLATELYEEARGKVRSFINAEKVHEIIFTKGSTDGINLVASSFGREFLKEGDEVIISQMEHHSNIVPWQMICEERKAVLKFIPITDSGELEPGALENLLSDKTKIVSLVHVSNTLGTINPIKEIIEKAHGVGAKVLIDGAQALPHLPVDVQDLNCDFYVFSGHKIFGPTGTGILYGKEELLNQMPPYQGGGDMIKEVKLEKTTFNELPFKFEAGTPNIEGNIVLGIAIDFILETGYNTIQAIENELFQYAIDELNKIQGIKFIGTAENKASVISMNFEGCHPYDVGALLDKMGIAVRTGHHCTQPIMDRFEIPGTVRASLAFYNTFEDIDSLVAGIRKATKMLR